MEWIKQIVNQIVFSSLLLLFAAPDSIARIGETPEQCQERYGPPSDSTRPNALTFRRTGMLVVATFHEGYVDAVLYRKAEENALKIPLELSDHEITVLLKSNGGDRQWKQANEISVLKTWVTTDGSLIAQYHPLKRILAVFTKDHRARFNATKAAEETKQLEGF